MRVILLGRKPPACQALRDVLARGMVVVGVVDSPSEQYPYPETLTDTATALGIPVLDEQRLYESLADPDRAAVDLGPIDLVLSVLYQRRIRRPLIELPRMGCVNFHPGPLPEFRGWGGYNVAILEAVSEWGAAAHFVDESFDTGPVIAQTRFAVDTTNETAFSLVQRTEAVLLELFRSVVDSISAGKRLCGTVQGSGRTFKKGETLAMREIRATDSRELVDRKVRAFWYPPFDGAYVEIGGQKYSLANDVILRDVAARIWTRQ